MAISNALTSALSGLMAQSNGLDVVGHNVANANTPGYSRQRADMTPALPTVYPWGAVGRGVETRGIERIVDEFLHSQQRDSLSLLKTDETMASAYSRLEAIFNELSENDLSTLFNRFYNALQDLSVNVEGEATRSVVVQQALALRDTVNVTNAAMRDYYTQLNNDVDAQVVKVNELIDEIADLNRKISTTEGGGQLTANDLRDRRDQTLAELAELVDITTIEQASGSVNVTTRGMPLVMLTRAFHLTSQLSVANGLPTLEVRFQEDNSPFMATQGELPAAIAARDQVLTGFMDDLDTFVAEFIYEFNRVHSTGGATTTHTSIMGENAAVDPATTTLDQIDLGFTPKGNTFQIQNGSVTIAIVALGSGEITEVNVPVDHDAQTLNAWAASFNARVPANTVTATVNGAGHLSFDVVPNSGNGFFFTHDSSGLLATMGVNTFWAGYDSATMDVNSHILADERLIATGKTLAPGDTDNLLDLLALRDQQVADGGTKTFEDSYRAIIGRMGTEGLRTNDRLSMRTDIVMRLENQRQTVSGVSLDEEMTKMIQFQRAYQAAARVISVSDIMLDTLINRT